MSYVVVVFGASGSGKSTLMSLLAESGSQYSIHAKGTDRPPRKYDDVEIRCVAEVTPREYDYIYQTYGYRYGIQRHQIDAALARDRHHFVICNDVDVIHRIKRDYGDRARVVFHYFDAPREALLDIQRKRGITDDEIDARIAKTAMLYRTWADQPELFDATLINRYGDDPNTTRKAMERMLNSFVKRDGETRVSKDAVQNVLLTVQQHFARNKHAFVEPDPSYAFLMMAITPTDPFLDDAYAAVERACAAVGQRVERVDRVAFTGEITEKILSSIELAGTVIADLTHERPNVYYEIGFAHGRGKQVILTAREGTKAHFDLQSQKIIFYRNATDLELQLTGMLAVLNVKGGGSA
jgi:ribose 1,5-bisphosphokinase PhnN